MFLFIITGILLLASYNNTFQTFLVKQYLKSLAKKLDTEITVGSVKVSLFNNVTINNLYVEDLNHDTLLYVNQLQVDVDEFSFKDKKIILDEVALNNTFFNLQTYKNEKGTNLNFIIDYFASDDTTKSSWKFGLNNLELRKTRFNYDNENYERQKAGIDYKHISMTYMDVSLSKIKLINKGIDCKVDQLKFFEQSGFQIDDFYTEANITPTGIITQNLKITTPYSKIDGNVTFLTDDYTDLSDFIKAVKIKSVFNTTKVDFKDICYFAPTLYCLNKSLNFKGEIKGTIDNLKGKKLDILLDDGTRFNGNVDISGLPDPDDMFLYVDVKELITTKERMESIPLYPFVKETFVSLPDNFRHLGAIRFKGNFTGFYHDFVAYGKVKTSLGDISTDVTVKIKNGEPHYKGRVITDHFNLGRFLNMPKDMGDITMDVDVDGKGFSKENIDATLVGEIKQVVIKNYNYNNVEVKGNFKKEIFNGFLAVQDENISFDFDGIIDLSKKIPEYHFISNIKDAKLAELHLIKDEKDMKTRFSTQLDVDLVGSNIDNLIGDVLLNKSIYNDKQDSIFVEKIFITSEKKDRFRDVSINSSVLDAKLQGEYSFSEIPGFINNFFVRYIPSQIGNNFKVTDLSHDLNFSLELHNSELISKLLLNGVEMSDHTLIEGNYLAKDHSLTINGTSPFLNIYGTKIDQLDFNGKAGEKVFDLNVNANKVYQNDSLFLDNFSISSIAGKDSLLNIIGWKNNNESKVNEAKISISTFFNGYDSITIRVLDSYAYISDTLWTINSDNLIKADTGSISFKALKLSSKTQSIIVDGQISNSPDDQIDILLKNFNLLSLKSLIPKNIINAEGIVDGVASITKQDDALMFTSDINFKNLRVNETLIGEGNVKSVWNTLQKSLKLNGEFYRDLNPSIIFNGYYYPAKEDDNLDINLKLNQTELAMFEKYTNQSLKGIEGQANADVSLTGTFKKPKLMGLVTLKGAKFTVKYLNTRYEINECNIDISPEMISFDNVEIKDEKHNTAWANGTIFHEWFTNWSLDIGLTTKNFLALNTTEKDNNLYNGKAYVSGFVDISGYDKQMRIDIDVKTEKNTTINIPLSDNEDLEENNFVEFISPDSSEVKVDLKEEVDLSNIEMNFDLEITPEAQVRLVFDDKIGDVMRSTGTGDLNLKISDDGDLNIYGNYVVRDGDYLFTLQNVINKRFDLEEGGTISWNGNPYDAEINLTAVYRLRARLYDLLANIDTSDLYKKRIPVDLKLIMKNEMMNPDITFDISLPTADEDTKSKVKSVLYVSDKDENIQELNKQVFSLLVLNTFLPPAGSETNYGHANVGSTTSSELLSNQLSNWLSKISNDFDIGINYRPGDELSNQELELALSTQLFNDRLILDGNLGLSDRQNVSNQAQNTNNLIGDVSLEYKITKDGKLRAKAFNNSNQFSLENTNSPYKQGVGLSYKKEYDESKFWKKIFSFFKKEESITVKGE